MGVFIPVYIHTLCPLGYLDGCSRLMHQWQPFPAFGDLDGQLLYLSRGKYIRTSIYEKKVTLESGMADVVTVFVGVLSRLC